MVTELKEGVYWVGVVDWALREFHGHELSTHRGSTYNSYLIIDEKIALVDTVWAPFQNQLIDNIREVIEPSRIDNNSERTRLNTPAHKPGEAGERQPNGEVVSPNRKADVVDNLLELSRWQSDRLVLRQATVDIGEIIAAMVGQSSKKSTNHRIVGSVLPGLPKVRADRTTVERVLDNLIDNAIKYSPNGPEVTVSAREQDDHVLVSVRDRGIGIPAADVEKLFQPFARLQVVVPGSAIQGIGLGLVVCRRLVEAQGRRIWVESDPGKGSTHNLTQPVSGCHRFSPRQRHDRNRDTAHLVATVCGIRRILPVSAEFDL